VSHQTKWSQKTEDELTNQGSPENGDGGDHVKQTISFYSPYYETVQH